MKYLLLALIRLYWLIPKRFRRTCLFKETCSHHVFTVTNEKGFRAGLKALKKRIKQCRPGYSIYITDDEKHWIILNDHSVMERGQMNI